MRRGAFGYFFLVVDLTLQPEGDSGAALLRLIAPYDLLSVIVGFSECRVS